MEGVAETLMNGTVEVPAGSSALDALQVAAAGAGKAVETTEYDFGTMIDSIAGETAGTYGGWDGWLYSVLQGGTLDPDAANVGASGYQVHDGDDIVFYYGDWGIKVTKLEVPAEVVAGEAFTVRLKSVADDSAIVGATVYSGESSGVTDETGEATLTAPATLGSMDTTAEKRDETSEPAGKPLIVRPIPVSINVVAELSNPLPTVPTVFVQYNQTTDVLSVTGSISNSVRVTGILTPDNGEPNTLNGNLEDNNYALSFINVVEGSYTLEVFGVTSEGTEGPTATKMVSLTEGVRVTDEMISQTVGKSIDYLKNQQDDNGNLTDWGAIALKEAGKDLIGPDYIQNGNTHFDYMENHLIQSPPETVTDLARVVLTLALCEQDPRNFAGADWVAELLLAQDVNGHFGTDINSHIWAVSALTAAGENIPMIQDAKVWLLERQNNDGSWGITENGAGSSDSTAEAVIALRDLGEPQDSANIQEALVFLKTMQQADGGFKGMETDQFSNQYSTSEVVRALLKIEENPLGSGWVKPEADMLSYLTSKQSTDGKIGSTKGTADVLYVLSKFSKQFSAGGTGTPETGETPGIGSNPDSISIYITVTGKNGATVLSRRRITVNSGDEFGMTPLGALAKTNLSYTTKFDDAYVSSIDGVTEDLRGTAGWVWEVNGDRPGLACNDFTLEDGDEVVWLWVNDAGEGGFDTVTPVDMDSPPEINSKEAKTRELISKEARKYLEENSFSGQLADTTPLFGIGRILTDEEIKYWQAVIKDSDLDEEFSVSSGDETTLQDKRKEIRLEITRGAIKKSVNLNVRKLSMSDHGTSGSHDEFLTPIYEFGPSGLQFSNNVFVTLKAIIPPGQSPFDVYMAWYDEDKQEWVKVPAVIDLASGEITGSLQHFSKYAVFYRETKFSDMENYEWAEEAMKNLVQRGIVVGVGRDKFGPERNVSRAEFVKMLINALGVANNSGEEQTLADLPDGEWYTPYVKQAIENGLVCGYPDGTFRPKQSISRQEMVKMMINSRKYLDESKVKPAEGAEIGFKDNMDIASWSKTAVNWAVENKIVKGIGDNRFYPTQSATTAQVVVVINNVLNLR